MVISHLWKKSALAGFAIAMALVIGVPLWSPVRAAEHANPVNEESGRYTMSETEDGFLRLDRKTGHVSQCRKKTTDWVCETIADDRAAYEAEIARLAGENEALRARLQSAEKELPSEEEIDKAVTMFERFAKGFARVARLFKEEMETLNEELADDETGS